MNPASLRVLITGGAGFIGSHLVESLVRQGAKVRVFDNFSSGSRENLAAVIDDVEIVEGDCRDPAAVRAAVRGCDVVSHQAAQLEILRCLEDPIDDLRSNTEATIHVLEAATKEGVARVIYASSACVYGQPKYVPSDEARHPTGVGTTVAELARVTVEAGWDGSNRGTSWASTPRSPAPSRRSSRSAAADRSSS